MGARVLVIGDVTNDVVVRPSEPVAPDADTASAIAFAHGGSGANQAAWLAYLNTPVRFASRVGARDYQLHTDELRRAGVDARLARDSVHPTGSVVIIAQKSQRAMFTDRGAGKYMSAADLHPDLLEGISHLHVSGYVLFEERTRAALEPLVREAKRASIPTSVDPSSESVLRQVGAEAFLRWSSWADVCVPNLDEGRVLSGCSDAEKATLALTRNYAVVALKAGPDGAYIATGPRRVDHVPSLGAEVVDVTGAGDAFCAGFLTQWTQSPASTESGRAGVAAAAIAVGKVGGRPPFPAADAPATTRPHTAQVDVLG